MTQDPYSVDNSRQDAMADASDPLGAIAEEFSQRYRRGERPSLTEYCEKHPDHARRIRELFPALVLVEEYGVHEGEQPGLTANGRGSSLELRPDRIGDYKILREIGRGGMGVVYEAEQTSLGRQVALKVLPASAHGHPQLLERFRREARAAARLHHTNIVPIHDVGAVQGFYYYAMQFIHGQGLDQVLIELRRMRQLPDAPVQNSQREQPRDEEFSEANRDECPPETRVDSSSATLPGQTDLSSINEANPRHYFRSVARIGMQVAEALDYAHQRGVIHRDIKPSNLLLDTCGTVWVTDFGLAKTDDEALTQTGDLVGTLRYMAPERFQGRSDPRSDVYGLGMTLYELLTLQPAFDSTDRVHLIRQVTEDQPRPPRKIDPRVPRDLETIVFKAIEKDPDQRYKTAAQLVEDLRLFWSDRPIQARRSNWRERTWRWCRRNPALAGLLGALLMTFFLGFGGVTWKWREAEQAWDHERSARKDADDRAEEIRQGLERLKTANNLLLLGRMFAERRQWEDANIAFTQAISLRPDHVAARHERSELLALLALWDFAAEDFGQAFALQEPDTSSSWFRYALLQLQVGDVSGYYRTCRRMRERFTGTHEEHFSTELARTCFLGPDPDADLAQLVKNCERSEEAHPEQWFRSYLLGIAYFRTGQYEEAVQPL